MNKDFDLSVDQMKSYGYKIVDTIAEYWANVENRTPVVTATRDQMDEILNESVPEAGRSPEEVLDFITETLKNQSVTTIHPKFYSFVPGPSNFISTMSDTLATGFNVFSGGWKISPVAAQIEITTINWLLDIYGFPVIQGGGIFTSGGSMANLTAIATARRVKCGDDFSKAVIYLSDQAHSSNIKAIRVLGFKKEQIRIIPTDFEFRLGLNKLKNEIGKDRIKGLKPFCFIANAGTTNTGTVDPLNQISDICRQEDMWLHIDGAYGGAAILADNGNELLEGINQADSLTVDPHKWFFQPYEIGCLLVKDASWLNNTFSEKPEYLRDIEGNESEINFYDYGVQLTRRLRALKFYMSIKTYGLSTFRKAITANIKLAEKLEINLRKSPNWEVISPATLAIINYRFNPLDKHLSEEQLDKINQLISNKIMDNKQAFLVTTLLNKQVVLRMCLINPRTTYEHVMETIDQCEAYGIEILNDLDI